MGSRVRAGNRRDMRRLCEHPGERDRRGLCSPSFGERGFFTGLLQEVETFVAAFSLDAAVALQADEYFPVFRRQRHFLTNLSFQPTEDCET